jgi:hypothetical protein
MLRKPISFGFGSKHRITLALVLLSGIAFSQNSGNPLVGSWDGVMFCPAVPASSGAKVQCVFSLNGDYACLASRPGIGTVGHWGKYRVMANQIDLEIRGHEPQSVDMAPADHLEILSLTNYSLLTRSWIQGSYAYINFQRFR